jgi:hypothetical protein
MKLIFAVLFLFSAFFAANGQRYMTKNGYIGFYSHTPLEDIKADNNQVAAVLDISTGEFVFQVLVKSFRFPKALMELHFNENYMESDKFPRSVFKGKITNLSNVKFSESGTYEVTVEGDLSMHGVTNRISAKGNLEVLQGEIKANSKFIIVPEDYKINIPGVVRDNIAKTIEVTVAIKLTPAEVK